MATELSEIVTSGSLRATLTDTIQTAELVASGGSDKTLSITNGTSANQADRFIQDKARALTSGNNEDLDVFDLAVFDQTTDVIGNTTTFAEIVGLLLINSSSSAGSLVAGNKNTAAAWSTLFNGDTDSIILPPDSFFCIATRATLAWTVTDSSSHILRIAASGGNITYDIFLLGRSA